MVLGLWDLDEAIHSGNLTRAGHEQQLGEIEMHWGGEAHQQVRSDVSSLGFLGIGFVCTLVAGRRTSSLGFFKRLPDLSFQV